MGVLLGFGVVAGNAPAPALAEHCEDTATPGAGAVECLIDEVRRRHDLPPLAGAGTLAVAGERHARDMVEHHYFSHEGRDGSTFVRRISRAGYLRGDDRWCVGEVLAVGRGAGAAPSRVVRAWMHSPEHRAVLLRRRYLHIGVGIADGVPKGGAAGATYAVEFGAREAC